MVRLCPQCGVVAPQRSQRCLLCELPLGANTLERPDVPGGRSWVSVWCWFRCPTCMVDVPVDDFVVESIVCPSCGTAHGIRGLRRAFDHAHAVADLAGPNPEGRFPDPQVSVASENPFKAFGVLQSVSEDRRDELVTEDGVRRATVSVRVAPGHPLCEECHTPLRVTGEAGTLVAVCDGCAARFRSCVPPTVLRALGSVVGVLSIAHREDRPEALFEGDADSRGGGFRCPDCTTTLGDPQGRRVLTCEMCRRVCRVPAAHWHVRSNDAIPLQRVWVLFEGPSRMREELIRQVRRRAEQTVRSIVASRPLVYGSPSSSAPIPSDLAHVSNAPSGALGPPEPPSQVATGASHRMAVVFARMHDARQRRPWIILVISMMVVAVLAVLAMRAR